MAVNVIKQTLVLVDVEKCVYFGVKSKEDPIQMKLAVAFN